MTTKEIKHRYFTKVYKEAETIRCKCGCGESIKSKDRYGRDALYVNGHNGRKYDNPTQYKREWNHRNRKARYTYRDGYQKRRKAKLIVIKGGRCERCGLEYSGKNGCVFQFHHRNPKDKSFALTLIKMGRAWKALIKESGKCMLVCSNCHFAIHGSEF